MVPSWDPLWGFPDLRENDVDVMKGDQIGPENIVPNWNPV
jgi:hypothetical protein